MRKVVGELDCSLVVMVVVVVVVLRVVVCEKGLNTTLSMSPSPRSAMSSLASQVNELQFIMVII